MASSELNPSTLGVPELRDYLLYNYDFPAVQLAPYVANLADRYALPIQCLLGVLIAAPLGIVYNRRGVIGGVTGAITLLVVMMMSHSFFLMLGKGMRMNPQVSPWIPDVALGLGGPRVVVVSGPRTAIFRPSRMRRAGRASPCSSALLLVGAGAYSLLRHFPESARITGLA